jgi:hypothetical protein
MGVQVTPKARQPGISEDVLPREVREILKSKISELALKNLLGLQDLLGLQGSTTNSLDPFASLIVKYQSATDQATIIKACEKYSGASLLALLGLTCAAHEFGQQAGEECIAQKCLEGAEAVVKRLQSIPPTRNFSSFESFVTHRACDWRKIHLVFQRTSEPEHDSHAVTLAGESIDTDKVRKFYESGAKFIPYIITDSSSTSTPESRAKELLSQKRIDLALLTMIPGVSAENLITVCSQLQQENLMDQGFVSRARNRLKELLQAFEHSARQPIAIWRACWLACQQRDTLGELWKATPVSEELTTADRSDASNPDNKPKISKSGEQPIKHSSPATSASAKHDKYQNLRNQFKRANQDADPNIIDQAIKELNEIRVIRNVKRLDPTSKKLNRTEFIACAIRALQTELGISLTNKQVVAVLLMTAELTPGQRGRFGGVVTGDGKSFIIAVMAAYFGYNGRKIDIITVNEDLARRDDNCFRGFFSKLGLSSAFTPANRDRGGDTINYLTIDQPGFEALRKIGADAQSPDRQHGQEDERTAIVDEGDSLALDEATVLMRYGIPLDWNEVKGLIEKISRDHDGSLAYAGGSVEKNALARRVQGTVEVANAMVEERDYIIQDNCIMPVQWKYTGRIVPGLRYSDLLEVALMIKHGMDISQHTPHGLAAAISVKRTLLSYKEHYFLSATPPTSRLEATELAATYDITYLKIPPNNPSKLRALTHVLCPNSDKHAGQIVEKCRSVAQERPVLVIMKDIRSADAICRKLKSNGLTTQLYDGHSHLDAQGMNGSPEQLIDAAGQPGTVTVGTLIAGRGTDIRLTDAAIKAGGLHVIIGFIPTSERCFRQAAGRAARFGDPGSYQIIARKPLAVENKTYGQISSAMYTAEAYRAQRERDRIQAKADLYLGIARTVHKYGPWLAKRTAAKLNDHLAGFFRAYLPDNDTPEDQDQTIHHSVDHFVQLFFRYLDEWPLNLPNLPIHTLQSDTHHVLALTPSLKANGAIISAFKKLALQPDKLALGACFALCELMGINETQIQERVQIPDFSWRQLAEADQDTVKDWISQIIWKLFPDD